MSTLATVAGVLRGRGTPFAAIGAVAMAVHGVVRATTDVDLLVVDPGARAADGGVTRQPREGGATT